MIGDQVYDYFIKKAVEKSNSSLFEGDIDGIDTDEFIDRTNERNFVTFVNGKDGCHSYIGRIGQQQYIHLQRGCVTYFGEVQHEVMHALGFNHEQTRMDRDDFVDIIYDNIISGANIRNRKTLSASDVKKINLLNGCADPVTEEPATTTDPQSETEAPRPAVKRPQHHHRQQQKPDWLKDFERYFLNMKNNFKFFLSSQDVRNANGTQNASASHRTGCPADSPHKKRNDHCSNDQDCKDAGLEHVCCLYCEDKKCTNFCN
ncbi:putative High choriolytic enzyme 2 [Hypsibius exemplaris]|uniref:Metalloendopeptidase n=1 Tax=Hypsibius exemplaris TaxID=2072580 RepID=A0A9X6NGW0_HYPEX|nr:putative High choriolytic enzyme 2 [Hypsibius exemplaris]